MTIRRIIPALTAAGLLGAALLPLRADPSDDEARSLKADHVLHAVSAWSGTSCVGRATERALSVADRLGLRTLAFPALGTGAAHVSLETCANAMVSALRWRLALGGSRPLPELFAASGLKFDFTDKTIAPLMRNVKDALLELAC